MSKDRERSRSATRPTTGGRPVLLFVAAAVVVFVGLQVVVMSGVVNPRLGGGNRTVVIEGTTYQEVVVRNDAPSPVTLDGVRFAGTKDGRWPTLFEGVGDRCGPRDLVAFRPRTLAPGDVAVLYWVRGDEMSSDRMEARASGPSGMVRVVELPRGADLRDPCPPPDLP